MRDWFCPLCGGRLSYGIYCKTCGTETSFSVRPATGAEIEACQAVAAKAHMDAALAQEHEAQLAETADAPDTRPPAADPWYEARKDDRMEPAR